MNPRHENTAKRFALTVRRVVSSAIAIAASIAQPALARSDEVSGRLEITVLEYYSPFWPLSSDQAFFAMEGFLDDEGEGKGYYTDWFGDSYHLSLYGEDGTIEIALDRNGDTGGWSFFVQEADGDYAGLQATGSAGHSNSPPPGNEGPPIGCYPNGCPPPGSSTIVSSWWLNGDAILGPVIPGDLNNDGVVNAADYVHWRNNDSSQSGYDEWRTNFGSSLGSGSGAALPSAAPLSAGVPEPTTIGLIFCCLPLGLRVYRKCCPRTHSTATTYPTRRICICSLLGIWLGLTLAFCHSAHAATFQGLGGLDPTAVESNANDISADGTTVVGQSLDALGQSRGFLWTAAGGIQPIHDFFEAATAVSADGSIVVGDIGTGTFSTHAWLWSVADGLVGFAPVPSGFEYSVESGISDDGSVIVGSLFGFNTCACSLGYRWSAEDGFTHVAEGYPLTYDSASGVSADGNVVVGQFGSYLGGGGSTAYRSSATEPIEFVYPMQLGQNAVATAISGDGEVAIGYWGASQDRAKQSFQWTLEEGAVPFGNLRTTYHDLSADGATIVGSENNRNPFLPDGGTIDAVIQDQQLGLRYLQQVLVDQGLGDELSDWQLTEATAISADGLTIVGNGINPDGDNEAWIATLSPAPDLPGDYNQDGVVNAADYAFWRDGRKGDMTEDGYSIWRENFGNLVGGATFESSDTAVPEPQAALWLFTAGIVLTLRRMLRKGVT